MLRAHPDSVGAALATVQLEIRDDDGRGLPPGRDGDICARGPMVMPGYWRDDAAHGRASAISDNSNARVKTWAESEIERCG